MTSFPKGEASTIRKAFQNKENIQKNYRVLAALIREQFQCKGSYEEGDAEQSSDIYFNTF